MTSLRIQLDANNAVELTGLQNKPGSWGLIWYHRRPDSGAVCSGCLSWDPADATHWDLVSLEPLTLSPSLLCNRCGAHGFIRAGHWVPA